MQPCIKATNIARHYVNVGFSGTRRLSANLLGRRLSTGDGAGRSAADGAGATDLAMEGLRISAASRQHSMADEGPIR